MAFGGHTTWYCSSAKYAAITAWAAATVIAAGALRRQTAPAINAERIFVAVVAGTTHATTEPIWVTTRGGKTTDNTVTWQEATGIPALNGDLAHTPNWTTGSKSQAVTLGHVIKDDAGTHIFIATTIAGSGTGAGTEPIWNVAAVGNTTIENAGANQITWTYLGTSFTNWVAPHKLTQNMLAAGWGDSGVPTWFFVGHDHAESNAATISWAARGSDTAPINILCVSTAGSVPPVSADIITGATCTTTGANSINLRGFLRICHGISFVCGTTGGPDLDTSVDGNAKKYYKKCNFQYGVNSSSVMDGSNSATANVEFDDCTIKFIGTATKWVPNGRVVWRNGTMFDAAGTYSTTGVIRTSSNCNLTVMNVDLSALSALTLLDTNNVNLFESTWINCKLPSSFTFTAPTKASWLERHRMVRCSAAGDYEGFLDDFYGALSTVINIVRTTGAANAAGTKFAWALITNTRAAIYNNFQSFPIGKNNATTGSNVIVTIHGIVNAAAVPNKDELYMEVSYLGTAGNPQGSMKSSFADVLAASTGHTADSASAWDSGASARQNTHTYAVGEVLKVASNPGRLFFCTASTGNTAGSEPAGYASAVDGGSVTDGNATFRAGCRFSIAVTLTSPQPQIAGLLSAVVKAAKPSTTYYIDPFISLS